LTHSSSFYRK